MEPLNPDSKMWSVGTEWRGGYFQMRQFPRLFCFDIGGLWCYPALVKRGRHVCWLHLMLPAEPVGDGPRLSLFPPRCLAVTPVQSAALLEYRDLRDHEDLPWRDNGESVGRYPWREMGAMTLRDYSRAESALMALYDGAAAEFAGNRALPEEFVATYRLIVHPAFMPYIEFFAPDFARAVKCRRSKGR